MAWMMLCLGLGFDWFSVNFYHVARRYPVPQFGGLPVEGYPAILDQLVGLPARADAGTADVFVETDGVVVVVFHDAVGWPVAKLSISGD
jgi:hypothetical protein